MNERQMVKCWLNRVLRDNCISDVRLAKHVGVSRHTVHAWNKELVYPRIDVALKVSHYLGIPLHKLWDIIEY